MLTVIPMPIFYRGAGVGTYWHGMDARTTGFTARHPGMTPTGDRLMEHIARATTASPYISLTRSYAVAWDYAISLGSRRATARTPGYVYEVEIEDRPPLGLTIVDPAKEVASQLPAPLASVSYQYNGLPSFLHGVVDPVTMGKFLLDPGPQVPGSVGPFTAPNLTIHLKALVRALKDAEILAVGSIPASCVRFRHEVC